MTEIYASARAMLDDLAAKRISARELLDLHVARNASLTAKLNAVIRTDLGTARASAQKVDDARARGEALGLLAGLPMTVKDAFDVDGMPAHSGNAKLVNRPSHCADAAVVARVRQAGAVIWGKTNVPFMLEEWQSFNQPYGTTNNPYDPTRTPGGSSGGSAAALAAGLTPLEIGSDIGGSLRIPAHYCGVVSCKPTWNALPQAGHIIRMPEKDANIDLNVVGPMARTIGDLRLLWGVMRGASIETGANPVTGLRVARWTEAKGFVLGKEARSAVERAANALRDAGAKVAPTKPPVDPELLLTCYRDMLIAAIKENMRNLPAPGALQALRPLLGLQRMFGAAPLSFAGYGLALSAAPAQLERAVRTRDALKAKIKTFFEDVDVIAAPVTAAEAFVHTQKGELISRSIMVDGRKQPMVSNLQWIALATALHLPAVIVPAGRAANGMPLGVQLIGSWGTEAQLMDAAAAIEQRLGGFSPPVVN
jgi:amidase